MIFQNSSTFSFKRYLALLGFVALVTAFSIGTISYIGLRMGLLDFAFNNLYEYQINKIQTKSSSEIVFLGDSSLGNAIDAAYLSDRTGKPVINLALTGAYGYGGTYNMLRRTLAHWHPELIVVMQTPDMLQRSQIHEGFIHTAINSTDLWNTPPKELLAVIGNLDMVTSMLRRAMKEHVPSNTSIYNDYIRQGPPLSAEVKLATGTAGGMQTAEGLNRSQLYYLQKIAQTCRDSNIKCIYVHGPWPKPLCDRSQTYLAAANALISEAGLEVLSGTPLCVPEQDIGDALDHILPTQRRYYSDIYLEKLKELLIE